MRFDRLSRSFSTMSLIALAVLAIGSATTPAHAGFIVNIEQVGPDVFVTGGGTLDLSAPFQLQETNGGANASLVPAVSVIVVASGPVDDFRATVGVVSGPTNFGTGSSAGASSSSGDPVGMFFGGGGTDILVPTGYVSGNPLSDTSTYLNQTFASLGLTPGTYVWHWGTRDHADSFTLNVVPEPASLTLLGSALLGFGVIRRRRKRGMQASELVH